MFLWFHTHWHEGPSSRRATDLYLISHVRSHGGAFLLPVFFFFSQERISLSFVWVASTSNIYIYIRYLSSVFLHSAVTLLFHFFPSSFNDTQSVCLSPSFFFRRNPLSLYQSPLLFFFISSLSVISHSLSSPHFLCHVGTQAHSPDQPGLYNWLPPSSAQHCTYNIVAFQFLI